MRILKSLIVPLVLCLMIVQSRSAMANKTADWTNIQEQLRLHPDDPKLLIEEAKAYLGAMEEDKAADVIEKLLKLRPDYAEAYAVRGQIDRVQLKFAEAEKDYLKAIDLVTKKPDHDLEFLAKSQLAEIYTDQKKYREALPLYKWAAKTTGWGYLNVAAANCEIQLKMNGEAEADLREAVKRDPTSCERFASYGQFQIDQKQYEKAIENYTKAIDLSVKKDRSLLIRKHYKFYEQRALCYKKIGKDALAEKDLRVAAGWRDGLFEASPFQADLK